jgi:hypothetical protein
MKFLTPIDSYATHVVSVAPNLLEEVQRETVASIKEAGVARWMKAILTVPSS